MKHLILTLLLLAAACGASMQQTVKHSVVYMDGVLSVMEALVVAVADDAELMNNPEARKLVVEVAYYLRLAEVEYQGALMFYRNGNEESAIGALRCAGNYVVTATKHLKGLHKVVPPIVRLELEELQKLGALSCQGESK